MLISLLDIVLQNQMPQGGLLGGGAPPEANPLAALAGAQQGGGGQPPERTPAPSVSNVALDPEEEDRLQQQQLLTTGLGILASDPSQGTLGRIAEGALVGQQMSEKSRQDLLEQKIDLQKLAIDLREQEREEALNINRAQLFSNADLSDPNQRTEIMTQLLQAGDFEGAQHLNNFESNLPDGTVIENGREQIVIDPRTLEEIGRIQTPENLPEGTRVVDDQGGKALIANDTGEVIARFSQQLTPEELRQRQQEVFNRTNALADDFRSETGDLQQSVALGQDALDAPRDDPAAQQTLVIALNKLLDPGSVVRQSEFARVQEIGGFKSEAQTFANRLAREGQLPPEVEDTLRAEIARLSETNEARLQEIAGQYKERAQTFGVNPDFVVRRGLVEDEPEEVENPFEGL